MIIFTVKYDIFTVKYDIFTVKYDIFTVKYDIFTVKYDIVKYYIKENILKVLYFKRYSLVF